MNLFKEHMRLPEFFSRNWESHIQNIQIEPCHTDEDPLGYRVAFYADGAKAFVIGASFLLQRVRKLTRAGYRAPMTQRAIALVEAQLGKALDLLDTPPARQKAFA
ncbi:MAG: hypothetical protein IT558_06600 [Alphaproteobacteria bacterium]|nr:hypothetical protein [Alphaproteobacteria bacterium]